MPALGAPPSYSSQAASAFSSRKAVPGSTSRSIRSRAGSLPRERCRSDRLLAAAARDLRRPLAQLGDELLHPLLPMRELTGVAVELRGQDGHVRSLSGRSGH